MGVPPRVLALDYYTDVMAFAFAHIVGRVRSSSAAP